MSETDTTLERFAQSVKARGWNFLALIQLADFKWRCDVSQEDGSNTRAFLYQSGNGATPTAAMDELLKKLGKGQKGTQKVAVTLTVPQMALLEAALTRRLGLPAPEYVVVEEDFL